MLDINLAGTNLTGEVADIGKHLGENIGKHIGKDFVNSSVVKGLSIVIGVYVGFKILVGIKDTFYPSRTEHSVKHIGNVLHVSRKNRNVDDEEEDSPSSTTST